MFEALPRPPADVYAEKGLARLVREFCWEANPKKLSKKVNSAEIEVCETSFIVTFPGNTCICANSL